MAKKLPPEDHGPLQPPNIDYQPLITGMSLLAKKRGWKIISADTGAGGNLFIKFSANGDIKPTLFTLLEEAELKPLLYLTFLPPSDHKEITLVIFSRINDLASFGKILANGDIKNNPRARH